MAEYVDESGLERSAVADNYVASPPRGLSRRRRRWRRLVAALLVCLAVVATIGLFAGYVVQRSWTKRTATIDTEACHQASSSDGSTFTACALHVSYIDLDGRTRVALLTGVQQTRVHDNQVSIYLDPKSPATAINPETRIPLLVFVFFGVFAWTMLGGIALLVFREPQHARTSAARSPK